MDLFRKLTARPRPKPVSEATHKNLLIIDTDGGTDDAEAIMLALCQKTWTILGITCVHGNVDLEQAGTNVLRVLKVCEREDILVFLGAERALMEPSPIHRATVTHGTDGLGGVAHKIEVDNRKFQQENAADWLVHITQKMAHEVTICAIGPLTNLALAQSKCAQFSSNIKHLYIMGGNQPGLHMAEFNFKMDPEAAGMVLEKFQSPITLVPFETCNTSCLPWDWHENLIGKQGKNKRATFFTEMTNDFVNLRRKQGAKGYFSWDPFTVALAMNHNDLCVSAKKHKVRVGLDQCNRGLCLTDENAQEIEVVYAICTEKLMKLFEKMIE